MESPQAKCLRPEFDIDAALREAECKGYITLEFNQRWELEPESEALGKVWGARCRATGRLQVGLMSTHRRGAREWTLIVEFDHARTEFRYVQEAIRCVFSRRFGAPPYQDEQNPLGWYSVRGSLRDAEEAAQEVVKIDRCERDPMLDDVFDVLPI